MDITLARKTHLIDAIRECISYVSNVEEMGNATKQPHLSCSFVQVVQGIQNSSVFQRHPFELILVVFCHDEFTTIRCPHRNDLRRHEFDVKHFATHSISCLCLAFVSGAFSVGVKHNEFDKLRQ